MSDPRHTAPAGHPVHHGRTVLVLCGAMVLAAILYSFLARTESTPTRETRTLSVGTMAPSGPENLDFVEQFSVDGSLRGPAPGEVLPYYIAAPGDSGSDTRLYAALTVQSLYEKGLWRPDQRNRDFASRGQWLNGAGSYALMDLPPEGVGASAVDYGKARIAVGSIQLSVLAKGGGPLDVVRGTGTTSVGVYAPYANPPADWSMQEDTTALTDIARLRYYATGVQSQEVLAQASRVITRRGKTPAGPVLLRRYAESHAFADWIDGRATGYHEDNHWNVSPVVTKFLAGGVATAFIDNYPSAGRPVGPGGMMIHTAIAKHSAITSNVSDARISSQYFDRDGGVAEAFIPYVGVSLVYSDSSMFPFREDFCTIPDPPPTDDNIYGSERVNPRIRDLVMMEIDHPGVPPGEASLGAATGLFIEDQTPSMAGGAPLQVASLVTAHPAARAPVIARERYTGIVARGNVVLGNGNPPEPGYDGGFNAYRDGDGNVHYDRLPGFTPRDFVYINDLLHLVPMKAADIATAGLAAEEGVFLYFDVDENAPVLFHRGADATIERYTLGFDDATVAMGDVVAFGDVKTPAPDDIVAAATPREPDARDAWLPARVRAFPEYDADSRILTGLRLELRGLDPDRTVIYWKRVGHGTERWGETDWQPLTTRPHGGGLLTVGNPRAVFNAPSAYDGHRAYPRGIVQIMAIDRETDEAAGVSFYVSEPEGVELSD